MGFLSAFRADRLIAEIRESGDPDSPTARKALERLKGLGGSAIDPILAALATADKAETVAFVDVLIALTDNKTFPRLAKALAEENGRTVTGVAWALASARNYNPTQLLDLLGNPSVSRPALLNVIGAQRNRLTLRDLLNAAYAQEPSEKAALFRIIGEMADESSLGELLARVEGKDPIGRVHIIGLLSRFRQPRVVDALQACVRDPNKLVRSAALQSLASMNAQVDPAIVAPALRDNEMDVQNLAVEVLCKAKHPDTVRHLVDVLKDESEYARRAAVEVLNEVGDESSVKYLLAAIKDDDWWVRSRAADALGKIGGPRVINAALSLVTDRDEHIRRTAIEILNQTRDERAVNHLIEATGDPDWWVSERAVDALGSIGSKKAVPRLLEMLTQGGKATMAVIRALGLLKDPRATEPVLGVLASRDVGAVTESLIALTKLADEQNYEAVRARMLPLVASPEPTVATAARRAISEIEALYRASISQTGPQPKVAPGLGGLAGTGTSGNSVALGPVDAAHTMLVDSADIAAIVKAAETQAKLDISTLKSGDVRVVLKFLNPSVSQDEEMMQRFVHELRYSRKITHPNVIRIYDFLRIRGNFAISMEYFPSHTLGAEFGEGKPMDIRRAARFGIDIATGMHVAHAQGIVHRDLKPANVLINDQDVLKIVDFGVAAAVREGETQLTKTGYVIGSPKYMAPEQILGKKVDARADIYSLGVIIYEMLTGMPPYHRGDHMSVMYQHVQGRAKPPIEANPALPQVLSDLVTKAMAVDKAKRFQTMNELRLALEAFL
ncbi:MAG: HEAT repeat domain-containing protein [Steroidobacteraceae bacterium]|nr:HEAT repeat domain-containing protein [Steroidobacteraceae bacterium]